MSSIPLQYWSVPRSHVGVLVVSFTVTQTTAWEVDLKSCLGINSISVLKDHYIFLVTDQFEFRF